MSKKDTLRDMVEAEIPYYQPSDRAKQRVQETCRVLGDQLPARKSKAWKAVTGSAVTLCVCALMLFGTNAAFPALAESLPVVGGFFQKLNKPYSTALNMGKQAYGTNAGDYLQPVEVSTTVGDYTAEVKSAYSDGERLVVTVRMTAPQELVKQTEYAWVQSVVATVDGKELTRPEESSEYLVPTETDGELEGAFVFDLPEEKTHGETLAVQLKLADIVGKNTAYENLNGEELIDYPNAAFTLDFTATVNTDPNTDFDCDVTQNGITLHHVSATPTNTVFTVTAPTEQLDPTLYRTNGLRLRYNINSEYFGSDEDSYRGEFVFDGVEKGQDKLILRFERTLPRNNESELTEEEIGKATTLALTDDPGFEVVAEFTVDLVNKTVNPSETWNEDSVLNKDSNPYDYQGLCTEYGVRGEIENDLQIGSVYYEMDKQLFEVYIAHMVPEYKELKMEILDESGNVMTEAMSSDSSICNASYKSCYYDSRNEWWERRSQDNPQQESYTIVAESEVIPQWNSVVTVRITNPQTGEILTERTVTLSVKDRY